MVVIFAHIAESLLPNDVIFKGSYLRFMTAANGET